ncbi:MAG: hypothetical protein ACOY3J_03550 [Bacillota bacterium]
MAHKKVKTRAQGSRVLTFLVPSNVYISFVSWLSSSPTGARNNLSRKIFLFAMGLGHSYSLFDGGSGIDEVFDNLQPFPKNIHR